MLMLICLLSAISHGPIQIPSKPVTAYNLFVNQVMSCTIRQYKTAAAIVRKFLDNFSLSDSRRSNSSQDYRLMMQKLEWASMVAIDGERWAHLRNVCILQ